MSNEEAIQKIKGCGKVILGEYPHRSKAHDFALLVVALCDQLLGEKAAPDRSFPEEAAAELLRWLTSENKQLHEQVTRLQSLSNVQLLQSRGGQLGLVLNEGEQWVPLTDDVLLSCAPKEAQQSLSEGTYPRTIEGLSSWRLSDLLKAGEVRPVDPLGCTKPMSRDEKQFRAELDSENAKKLRVRFSCDTRHAFEKQLDFVNSAVYWSVICTATINHIKEYTPIVAELALRLLEERIKQALAEVRRRCLVAT